VKRQKHGQQEGKSVIEEEEKDLEDDPWLEAGETCFHAPPLAHESKEGERKANGFVSSKLTIFHFSF
jgi:hypothetical protein